MEGGRGRWEQGPDEDGVGQVGAGARWGQGMARWRGQIGSQIRVSDGGQWDQTGVGGPI